jgi:hypothetical protein
MRIRNLLLGVLGLLLLAVLAYQVPWVRLRADWGYESARAYVRGIIDPVQALPAPQVNVVQSPLPTFSPPAPSPTPPASPTPLPGLVQLPAPRYERQTPNNCGPATLAMYLDFYGWQGTQQDIADEIKPETGDRNVNVDELIHFAGNYAGWLRSTFRVGGTIELIKQFLAEGIPVMIEEGEYLETDAWAGDDRWAGHYVLITAYDEATQTFTYQDTWRGADLVRSYAETDEFWKQFNRVYLLIYRPDQEARVQELLGEDWDVDTNRRNALATAEREIQANAQDAYAWFNLGMNQVHFLEYGNAATAFDRARELGLPQRMLRYQFGPFFAYYNTGRMDDMRELLTYALRITDVSEEALIWMGWVLYREGDRNGAIQQFRLAQNVNPKSSYVQQALISIGVEP